MMTFVSTATPEEPQFSENVPTPKIFPAYPNLWLAYEARDYQFIVDDLGLTVASDISDEFTQQDRFFYALALERLGRDADALNAYVAIFEFSPDSVWGKLAAIHIEVAD